MTSKTDIVVSYIVETVTADLERAEMAFVEVCLNAGAFKLEHGAGVTGKQIVEGLKAFDNLPYKPQTIEQYVSSGMLIVKEQGSVAAAIAAITEYNTDDENEATFSMQTLRNLFGPKVVQRKRTPKVAEVAESESGTFVDEANGQTVSVNAETMFEAYAGMPADERVKFLFAALASEGVTPIVMDAVVDSLKAAKRNRVNSMV